MPPPTFDLQSHSIHSDGALPAAAVVGLAVEAGVELLALSDHDTVHGVEEALGAARAGGIRNVPAAELSAVHQGREDLHVLGYLVDHRDPVFLERLAAFRADRELRGDRMADALEEVGFEVERRALAERSSEGKPVGRPHLAAAVLAHPHNADRLEREELLSPGDVIERYLLPGAAAYHARERPTVQEAIAVIHDAGGVAVWAHPFWDCDQPEEVLASIECFRAWGLDGVEAFYVTHTPEQTHLLADRCERDGLLTTGSADFHGPDHERFDAFRAFDLHGREPVLGPLAG